MRTSNDVALEAALELHDADLNRQFVRAYWNLPVDERNNTYWHDDDTTPEDENHEWKPLPDFVNNWSAVKKVLVGTTLTVPVIRERGLSRKERTRRIMAYMIVHQPTPLAARSANKGKE